MLGCDVYHSKGSTVVHLCGCGLSGVTESQWLRFVSRMRVLLAKYAIEEYETADGLTIACKHIRNIRKIMNESRYPYIVL